MQAEEKLNICNLFYDARLMKPFDGACGRWINEKIILSMEAGLMKKA